MAKRNLRLRNKVVTSCPLLSKYIYQYFVCYNYKRSVPKPLTFNSIELNPNDNLIPYHNLIANCSLVSLKCTIFQRRIRRKQMLKKRRIKPRERVRALVEEPRNLVKNKLLVTFEVSTHVTVNGNTPYLYGHYNRQWKLRFLSFSQDTKLLV